MNKRKALNLMGLALRAGKLVTGEAGVMGVIRNQSACLVIVGQDASDNTKKNFSDKCQHYNVPLSLDFTTDEISQAIGRQRTSIALTDQGFTKSMKKLIE